MKQAAIKISDGLVKKLDLKYGDIVEAKIGKGQLVILKKEIKSSGFMKFAGIWADDRVDKTFRNIRKGWNTWAKKLSA